MSDDLLDKLQRDLSETREALALVIDLGMALVNDHFSGCFPERKAALIAAPKLLQLIEDEDENPRTLDEIIALAVSPADTTEGTG